MIKNLPEQIQVVVVICWCSNHIVSIIPKLKKNMFHIFSLEVSQPLYHSQKTTLLYLAKKGTLLDAVVTCSVYVSLGTKRNNPSTSCRFSTVPPHMHTHHQNVITPKTCMLCDYCMPYSCWAFCLWLVLRYWSWRQICFWLFSNIYLIFFILNGTES